MTMTALTARKFFTSKEVEWRDPSIVNLKYLIKCATVLINNRQGLSFLSQPSSKKAPRIAKPHDYGRKTLVSLCECLTFGSAPSQQSLNKIAEQQHFRFIYILVGRESEPRKVEPKWFYEVVIETVETCRTCQLSIMNKKGLRLFSRGNHAP